MEFSFWPAIFAGLLGGIAMSALSMMMKPMGMQMDINRIWGAMFGLEGGAGRLVGFMMHLVVSALIALVYAWGFDLVGAEDNLWAWGLLGAAIHWGIGGLVMGMMPAVHPAMPERIAPPGVFVANYGMPDVPGFLMGHLVYGLLVGVFYQWFA